MAAKKKSSKAKGRDDRGRFAAGNPGGPGGAQRRACEFRRAAEEAVTVEHIQAMMRKTMAMALQGDLGAARFVAERVMGKPADAPNLPEQLAIDVPSLRAIEDCTNAIETLIQGICEGKLDAESARLLTSAVQARMKAIELTELDQRLTRVEQAADRAAGVAR
jgi:hypothetical protein